MERKWLELVLKDDVLTENIASGEICLLSFFSLSHSISRQIIKTSPPEQTFLIYPRFMIPKFPCRDERKQQQISYRFSVRLMVYWFMLQTFRPRLAYGVSQHFFRTFFPFSSSTFTVIHEKYLASLWNRMKIK